MQVAWSPPHAPSYAVGMTRLKCPLRRDYNVQFAQELATIRDAQRMSPALVMRDPYIHRRLLLIWLVISSRTSNHEALIR